MAAWRVSAASGNSPLLSSVLLLVALTLQLVARTTSGEASSTNYDVNVLFQNQGLLRNQYLSRPPYKLIMQSDCNLVLYHSNQPLWASQTRTDVEESCYFVLQADGNGVIYNSANQPVFSTKTSGLNDGDHVITLRSDGDLTMNNDKGELIWHTGTAGR